MQGLIALIIFSNKFQDIFKLLNKTVFCFFLGLFEYIKDYFSPYIFSAFYGKDLIWKAKYFSSYNAGRLSVFFLFWGHILVFELKMGVGELGQKAPCKKSRE